MRTFRTCITVISIDSITGVSVKIETRLSQLLDMLVAHKRPPTQTQRRRPLAGDVMKRYAEVVERGLNRTINIIDTIEILAPKIKLAAGLI